MISQTAEYALRAIVFLCDHPDESYTAERISAHTKVPLGYLSKIMQQLVRNKLVNSRRGPYGGFTIAQPKEEITVLTVLNIVDPLERIHQCPVDIKGHGSKLCPLHRLLDNTIAYVERSFAKVSIADLLNQQRDDASYPLCEFPRHDASNSEPVRRPVANSDNPTE